MVTVNRPRFRALVVLPVAVVGLAVATAGCTEQARKDAAETVFIKAVNLKCKVMKTEAKLAWSVADQMGVDDKAKELAAQAKAKTDSLIAEINSLGGPTDISGSVKDLLKQSSAVVTDVSKGRVSVDDGKAKLEDLRQQAKDKGIGECVTA